MQFLCILLPMENGARALFSGFDLLLIVLWFTNGDPDDAMIHQTPDNLITQHLDNETPKNRDRQYIKGNKRV